MTPSSILVLLQVCSLQLIVVSKPTCRLEGDLVQSAHHLLLDLGGEFPVRCRPYNPNMSSPVSAFPAAAANQAQCPRALWVLNESLQWAWQIFENNDSPVGEGGVTWDPKKLERFQNLQVQLMDQGSCLPAVDGSGVLAPYFRNVTEVLQQQDSAACGWLVLRRELLRVLLTALADHRTCFTWRKKRRTRSHAH